MQLNQKDIKETNYEIFEDKRVIKFLDNHCNDSNLQNRLEDKYYWLSINPYKEAEKSFKIKNVLNVKKLGLEIIG